MVLTLPFNGVFWTLFPGNLILIYFLWTCLFYSKCSRTHLKNNSFIQVFSTILRNNNLQAQIQSFNQGRGIIKALHLNPLSASVALMPIWRQHWHLMGQMFGRVLHMSLKGSMVHCLAAINKYLTHQLIHIK